MKELFQQDSAQVNGTYSFGFQDSRKGKINVEDGEGLFLDRMKAKFDKQCFRKIFLTLIVTYKE